MERIKNMKEFYCSTPRYCDIPTFMRIPQYGQIDNPDIIVIGIPFDDTSSYRSGSRFGPREIRNASTCLKKYNRCLDVDIFADSITVDYGDIPVIPGYIEKSYTLISECIKKVVVHDNAIPISIGGDHGIILPELRGLKEKHGKLSVISFDAHRDCSKSHFGELYGHGTTLRRAIEEELIEPSTSVILGVRGSGYSPNDYKIAQDLSFNLIDMETYIESNPKDIVKTIRETVGKNKCILTFDMDCVDPAYAPAINTPEIGGFTSRECLYMIRNLTGINIVAADLVEVNPQYDSGGITNFLAASILFEIISVIVKNLKI
ncbi:agmatinase [Anaeromicropila populeti]|uniref:Agmatinase n=1 Tax=Anaeromicropila populeti TaxID=37658 RepID=A0A1I6L0D8_9FIRM|nr:agmatinase [Anaeromicropila populeti]SFR96935.1 agmatinase [Anaeromicropila populeti]